ncbi:MAG: RNA-binding transcriptional accessory protein, partial [Prolixibacteraceae bacterium]|nr:RNA-binding transcriptional accessory protein [Prolixibacteraceae bacterium]
MKSKITEIIANNLGVKQIQVSNTIFLLNEGATVPFISRYRKERTGSLDEVQILRIKELNEKFSELEKRKETILKTVDEQKKLTPELKIRIENCFDSVELKDIYLP